jgi:hypothetical protein
MRFEILCSLAAAGALAAAGCDTTEPAYTVIGGTIDQGTFPAPVQQITFVSDRGVVDQAPVDAKTGAFELRLVWGSAYVFLLSPDGQGTPLVVSTGNHGELEVETGGLSADIGTVRYWGGTPSGSTTTQPAACAGGVIQGTAQPCSTGAAVLACDGIVASSDGQRQRDQDGMKGAPRHHHHDGDDDDGTDEGGGDGVLTASPDAPMAIPSRTLPPVLGCSDHLE